MPKDVCRHPHTCLFFACGAQTGVSAIIARSVPYLRDRILADPLFLFKIGAEVVIDSGMAVQLLGVMLWHYLGLTDTANHPCVLRFPFGCAGCATVAEVRKRGNDFWAEFEFYLSDLFVGLVSRQKMQRLKGLPVSVHASAGSQNGRQQLSTATPALGPDSIPCLAQPPAVHCMSRTNWQASRQGRMAEHGGLTSATWSMVGRAGSGKGRLMCRSRPGQS